MSKYRFESADVLVVDGMVMTGKQPALLANLPGILRGEGIFETFLATDGVPTPLLRLHDERLHGSAELMGMDLTGYGLQRNFCEIQPLLGAGTWRVRYTVLRALDRGLLHMWTAGAVEAPAQEVQLLLSKFRTDPQNPLAGAKTTSRAHFQVAHAKAVEKGCFDALLPTIDGDMSECTASNLLAWIDDRLWTPSLERGILGGVTRNMLLQGCRDHQIPVCEVNIWTKDLERASEVFVTNAIIGVIPVCKIVGVEQSYPGACGPMLPLLRQAYANACAGQSPTRA
ncbi:MAG: aminotransferase class IV [Planctomycetes bacterium]|nr:aminotransferase class IV [Planctomycetota bacterium]